MPTPDSSPDPIDLMEKYGADGLRFGLLRIARFIGEMIGERPQRLYINGATALLKNENRFFQGTQCRG